MSDAALPDCLSAANCNEVKNSHGLLAGDFSFYTVTPPISIADSIGNITKTGGITFGATCLCTDSF